MLTPSDSNRKRFNQATAGILGLLAVTTRQAFAAGCGSVLAHGQGLADLVSSEAPKGRATIARGGAQRNPG
jgi:hypothetical protein